MKIYSVKYMLMAQDMDRGIAFYRDVIGLELKFSSQHWTELAWGDLIIALHGGGTGAFQKTGLGFQVADIEAACQEVAAGGGKILMPPSSRPGEPILLAELADPEGNGFSFSQYVGND